MLIFLILIFIKANAKAKFSCSNFSTEANAKRNSLVLIFIEASAEAKFSRSNFIEASAEAKFSRLLIAITLMPKLLFKQLITKLVTTKHKFIKVAKLKNC